MTMADLSPGAIVDNRYKVLSRLGAGGMADVFLAEDQQLGRKVALKLLHRRFAEDPGFVERFRREAQAAAGLQHPNVVGIYDRGACEDTYYIAMEYLPGRSLKQLIRQEAPLAPIRAIDITIQILKAARFAHRRGVIHRDLKPHNVIVDESDHAKVTDFGIARAGASDMTETGSIMGTAQYLSPEQAQGHAVSAASDLYAIGVVLYEMLTGRVPFDAESAVTIALKHVAESPMAPTAVNPRVPPELEQVVLWSMNKNPADRPTDADQFISALEAARTAILSGEPSQRTASIAALAAVGGVGAAYPGAAPAEGVAPDAAVVLYQQPPYDGTGYITEPAQPPPRRRRMWPWIALLVALLLAGGGVAAYLLTRPEKRTVPDVTGRTLNTARTVLQNEGFVVNVLDVTSNNKAGTVIGQQPQGSTKVDKGSTVTLTVSTGPGNTTVPSVVGLPAGAAEHDIVRARLKFRTQRETSNTIPAGRATRTQPGDGQSVPVGIRVTLFISSGKPVVTVPNVVGQSEGAARALLGDQGFVITTSTQTSTTSPNGDVISQSPAGDSEVAPGSTINLVVAKAPPTASVPDVTGDTARGAGNQLKAAGFKVVQQSKAVTKQNKDGIVISEQPGAGTTLNKGSTVTIVVGKFTPPPTSTTPTTTTPNTTPSTTTPTTTTT
jgi:beta-lactam-binding protein with PASTA domain/predicted Ser/Thr protein kinase